MNTTEPIAGTRKIKLLYVDPVSFMSLFKNGFQVENGFKIVEGLPEDARMLAVTYDFQMHGVVFVTTSEEYEDVPPGQPLPHVQVSISPLSDQ